MSNFQTGDVVHLKSDHQLLVGMVVCNDAARGVAVGGPQVFCWWIDRLHHIQNGYIPEAVLVKSDDNS